MRRAGKDRNGRFELQRKKGINHFIFASYDLGVLKRQQSLRKYANTQKQIKAPRWLKFRGSVFMERKNRHEEKDERDRESENREKQKKGS